MCDHVGGAVGHGTRPRWCPRDARLPAPGRRPTRARPESQPARGRRRCCVPPARRLAGRSVQCIPVIADVAAEGQRAGAEPSCWPSAWSPPARAGARAAVAIEGARLEDLLAVAGLDRRGGLRCRPVSWRSSRRARTSAPLRPPPTGRAPWRPSARLLRCRGLPPGATATAQPGHARRARVRTRRRMAVGTAGEREGHPFLSSITQNGLLLSPPWRRALCPLLLTGHRGVVCQTIAGRQATNRSIAQPAWPHPYHLWP